MDDKGAGRKPREPLLFRIGLGNYTAARRVARMAIGFTLLAIGMLLIVLPGPAFIVIPAALAILAGEFLWARVLLRRLGYYLREMKKGLD